MLATSQRASGDGAPARHWNRTANDFIRDLRDPPCLVAMTSVMLVLAACVFVAFFVERNPIRAYPPKPPTKAQIRAMESIDKTFNPAPPAQRQEP